MSVLQYVAGTIVGWVFFFVIIVPLFTYFSKWLGEEIQQHDINALVESSYALFLQVFVISLIPVISIIF